MKKLLGYCLFYPLWWMGRLCFNIDFGDGYQFFMVKSVEVSDYFNLNEWH